MRTLQRALHRPRPAMGQRRRPARRRERALPGVLEPRLHAVRPHDARRRQREPRAAAGEQHRHRPRPGADGRHPAGRRHGLRDRHVRAADGARAGAGDERARRARAADPRRPLARDDVPHRRRRRALQRGPRLHPAPDHAACDPAGQPDRDAAGLPAAVRREGDRDHGPRLPRAGARARPGHALGALRGGGLRPHAGAGHEAARGGHRALARVKDHPGDRRLQAARHLRLPVRGHAGAGAGERPRGRHHRLRRAHGGAARTSASRWPIGGHGDRWRARAGPRAVARGGLRDGLHRS